MRMRPPTFLSSDQNGRFVHESAGPALHPISTVNRGTPLDSSWKRIWKWILFDGPNVKRRTPGSL